MTDETHRMWKRHRAAMTADLQKHLKRPRQVPPVQRPDELAAIQNVIRPALEMPKFGSHGMSFLMESPEGRALAFMCKEAGWWDDFKTSIGEVGSGLKSVGTGLYNTSVDPLVDFWSHVGRGGNVWEGTKGLARGAWGGLGEMGEGLADVGGGLVGTLPYGRTKVPQYIGREVLPWFAPYLGPAKGVTRVAKAGRLLANVAWPANISRFSDQLSDAMRGREQPAQPEQVDPLQGLARLSPTMVDALSKQIPSMMRGQLGSFMPPQQAQPFGEALPEMARPW